MTPCERERLIRQHMRDAIDTARKGQQATNARALRIANDQHDAAMRMIARLAQDELAENLAAEGRTVSAK